jgi:hypothetical protein
MPISLGKLIKLLELEKQDNHVQFDFGGFEPTSLASYRGYYEQLALGFQEATWDDKSPTVKSVLQELKNAIGKTYEGYKGGDYKMSEDTHLWVANYGEANSTAIVGLAIVGLANCDSMTVIETRWEE